MPRKETTATEERLLRCRSAQARIDTLFTRRTMYATLSTPSTTRVRTTPQSSTTTDHVPYYLIKMEELTEQLREEIVKEEAERQACRSLLARLPLNMCQVMQLYYCEGLSWKEVAKQTEYSIESCMKIRKRSFNILNDKSVQSITD